MPPWLLIHTVPACRRAAMARAWSRSADHTDAPRPTSTPLAHSTACSRSVYLMMGSAGPNCSSCTSGAALSMSAIRVLG